MQLSKIKISGRAVRRLSGANNLQTSFPIGGLGAGNVCLNGYGGIQDFSIRHSPAITAMPDSHMTTHSAFGLLHLPGRQPITRLVEGPIPVEKIYDQGLQGQGYRHGGYEGLPRYEKSSFEGAYPFGKVLLQDPELPLETELTAFNPFIPLDDKNSGIPCAILEYTFRNRSSKAVPFEFSYHLSHLAPGSLGRAKASRTREVPSRGVYYFNMDAPGHEMYGSACLLSLDGKAKVKGSWFRGGWFDAISALWREVSTGQFTCNPGNDSEERWGRNGGSILFQHTLKPGEEISIPIVITWYFPNCSVTAETVEPAKECCEGEPSAPAWRPYYAGIWKDALEVAEYVRTNYYTLRERTVAFAETLFGSTLPAEIVDAVAANLSILKSPTIHRQENGNLWGWEGCFPEHGCCAGSCTHVWNYAQSICHLFPSVERTLREQELDRSQNEEGHIAFRAALPDGPAKHLKHAAADGQLGGILKLWRDWHISGDTEWMTSLYPLAKRSLDYCIRTWDPDRIGALREPHHNTYDIEFWGPDGMCGSIYVGALSALAEMAGALGKADDEASYRSLSEKAAAYMEKHLFNGEYFEQKVEYKKLKDQSIVQRLEELKKSNPDEYRLVKAEGPKYQYGKGCISDGVIGAWMADFYGVKTPLNRGMVRKNLKAIHKYNFKADLRQHANPQRPGYAMGKEAALLLCTWPRGEKPTLPFVYSDEAWPGIEYQVASHMIAEGLVEEGLEIVRAVRARFDGRTRNPWNEYECGSYYARSMASYALLQAYSGFHYSAVTQTLTIAPKVAKKTFRCFFSTATGYGNIEIDSRDRVYVSLVEGWLDVNEVHYTPFEGKKIKRTIRQRFLAGSAESSGLPSE